MKRSRVIDYPSGRTSEYASRLVLHETRVCGDDKSVLDRLRKVLRFIRFVSARIDLRWCKGAHMGWWRALPPRVRHLVMWPPISSFGSLLKFPCLYIVQENHKRSKR